MAELKAQITRIAEVPVINDAGNVEPRMRVEFKVGEQGPFTVTIPHAQFTPERVRDEVNKVARPIIDLLGGV